MRPEHSAARSPDAVHGQGGSRTIRWIALGAVVAAILVAAAVFRPSATPAPAMAAQAEGLSLITETPDEGFALAVTLSRRGVTTTQPDREVLHALRPEYASDAGALIASSHVIAVYFQTIAEANDFWRD